MQSEVTGDSHEMVDHGEAMVDLDDIASDDHELMDHGDAMVDLDASSVGASSHAVMDHGDAMVDLDAASSLGASSVGGGAMVSFPEQDPAPQSLSLHL